MARPTKYTDKFPEKAFKLAAKGLKEKQIAKKLGISESTYFEYKKEFSEFSESIKRGIEESIDIIENSLWIKARGQTYKEKKVEIREEAGYKEKKTTITTKKVLPSDTAMIFYLKNRRPSKWSDKHEIELPDNIKITIEGV